MHEGKAKGGRARAAKLTPQRRHEIAMLGVEARWGKKKVRYNKPGHFKLEKAERRIKMLEAVLIELVLLKQMHEEIELALEHNHLVHVNSFAGKQESHKQREPIAWRVAFQVVKELGYHVGRDPTKAKE